MKASTHEPNTTQDLPDDPERLVDELLRALHAVNAKQPHPLAIRPHLPRPDVQEHSPRDEPNAS